MDSARLAGWSGISSRGRGIRRNFPPPIWQIPEPSSRHHPCPLCVLPFPRQTPRPYPRQTHDPVVATDDEKIAECCRGFGADVIMTSESCRNGTERCNEALQKLEKKYDIVVNIQGDEPLLEPEIIDGVVQALQGAPDAVFSTAVTSLKPEDGTDPNRVKCVVDKHGYAIYFSRGLIPYNKSGKVNPQFPYLLHLGIQSYDSKFLKIYPQLPPTHLQLEEDLEQLKVLENGYKMKVIKVDHDAHGVDAPEDVEKIEMLMRERNIS
ncbi:3-deoxy-manno-octulosonate cytidylyltransferase, mitochondrial isoform X3 [Magnolia sinica]|uniref:3-deoxy-manno-octulosonate cytidylyltransferase, mitochondrial isoform X3 n=1 Tax=Magnolia sinica TaxID=86752 RepID=UPI002658AEF0|nr:3-deoxy-manno-octulosonate cytidylyltransferase, mitochondrial isoform X3 [Magnolia sinica]